MARDGEHFFMFFLAILISSFEKVLFSSVAHFFIGSLILGKFSFLSSGYTLVISLLSDKADTLKQQRPIGEGDQELEKSLDQEELT
jgi:hypothetical protein